MSTSETTLTPHDSFFKKSLENPNAAKQLVTRYLPKDIIALIDLNSLEPQPTSFIDDSLKATSCDVAFRVNTKDGRAAYI